MRKDFFTPQGMPEKSGHTFFPDEGYKGEPKGIIQFIYGITSKTENYEKMFEHFTDEGYTVYCLDLMAHGNNKTEADAKIPNYFTECLKQQQTLNEHINKLNENSPAKAPVICMGHSNGSYLLLDMMKKPQFRADNIILTGMGDIAAQPIRGTNPAINLIAEKASKRAATGIMYYTQFKPKKDDLPKQMVKDLMAATDDKGLYNAEKIANHIGSTPVSLISGEGDLTTNGGEATKKLNTAFVNAGINSSVNIIKGMKHSITINSADPITQEITRVPHPACLPVIDSCLQRTKIEIQMQGM